MWEVLVMVLSNCTPFSLCIIPLCQVFYDGLCPVVTLYNGTVPIASVNSSTTTASDRVNIWCNGTVQIKKVNCYDSASFVLVAQNAHGVADGAIILHVVQSRSFGEPSVRFVKCL
jgi:hypothetical protein